MKGRITGRRRLGEFGGLVTPDTILRWYRELLARKYDGSTRRRNGRPFVATDAEQLVVWMATENPTWGVHAVDRGRWTRSAIRSAATRSSAFSDGTASSQHPRGGKRMLWKTFLRTHLGAIAAADFFSVEVLTLTGLVRHFVLLVIDIQTRRVQIGGVVRQPYGAWMAQVARNLTDGVDEFLIRKRYLLHDRDPLLTAEFRRVLAATGVTCMRLPAHSPNLNSMAERFVLSIKSECLILDRRLAHDASGPSSQNEARLC